MISERDFVLNNYFQPCFESATRDETIGELKNAYKKICEKTSEESEDSLWLDGYNRIKFSDITKVSFLNKDVVDVHTSGMFHQLFGEDTVKFKQWFERKRG